eukprot:5296376-Amphidinium_carterae.1
MTLSRQSELCSATLTAHCCNWQSGWSACSQDKQGTRWLRAYCSESSSSHCQEYNPGHLALTLPYGYEVTHASCKENPDFIVFSMTFVNVAMIISESLGIPIVRLSMALLQACKEQCPFIELQATIVWHFRLVSYFNQHVP